MNLPIQSRPVMRSVSTAAKEKSGVQTSSLGCTICHAGCNLLPEPAKSICHLGCDRIAC